MNNINSSSKDKVKKLAEKYVENVLGLDYIGAVECEHAYIAGYEQALKDLNGKNNIKHIDQYIVTDDDLRGDIANFPVKIVQAMVDYQSKYHNKPDPSVFARNLYATIDSGGFDWDETTEGCEFWTDVLVNKNFNRFFQKP